MYTKIPPLINGTLELPNVLNISELDMAGLFGNLMKNAIEGCRGLPEEKRYFSLTAETRHANRLYIVSTNSFDGHVRKRNGNYHSTKHKGRGTGLVSITAVAKTYHEQAQFSNNDHEFFVYVVLKV